MDGPASGEKGSKGGPYMFCNPRTGVGVHDQVLQQGFPELRVDRLGVPREQKMLKGHLPRVIYHQAYED